MTTKASSSLWTISARFAPPVLAFLFSFIAFCLFRQGGLSGFLFLGFVALVGLWIYLFSRHVVSVSFDEFGLHLSDWRHHEVVAWKSVKNIKRVRWIRGQPYSITFHNLTAFGTRVYMIPPLFSREPLLQKLGAHCVIDEAHA